LCFFLAAYYCRLGQWSKGDYLDPTNVVSLRLSCHLHSSGYAGCAELPSAHCSCSLSRICTLANRLVCQALAVVLGYGIFTCLWCALLQENDVDIMASKLGWAPTTLPTGSTLATAVALPILYYSSTTYRGSTTGVMNNPSTVHMYRFDSGAGVATVSCEVPPAWVNNFQQSNLNCQLRVLDSGNMQWAISNPAGCTYTNPVGLGTGNVQVSLQVAGR
jgi:hypothetical protein